MSEDSKNPDAPIISFLENVLDDKTKHPSLRTMAAQVLITYNKKFGHVSIEQNKPIIQMLRSIAMELPPEFVTMSSAKTEFADKLLEARINAAFQVLK